LGKERAQLERVVNGIRSLSRGLDDARELLDLGESEGDEATVAGVDADATAIATKVEKLEFQRMFSGEMDGANAFVDIQAGAGGTEAQDWAEMLLRMYLRWARQGLENRAARSLGGGEVAGHQERHLQG
jgi:peptide chain release factor 2